ncbi:MAG: hypothetical protein HUJ56_08360 [Erysipelotrichaceae bacterium]|nr:hypothetical protein [Erysipelotrichaceae bacterium]
MKRRFLSIGIMVVTLLALTGCSYLPSFKSSENTAEDKETDTTEMTEEPEVVDVITASLSFKNLSHIDFYELYCVAGDTDDWGEELLGADKPLRDNEIITYDHGLTYTNDGTLWNVMVYDADGNSIKFQGLDFSEAKDAEDITVVIEYKEDSGNYITMVE